MLKTKEFIRRINDDCRIRHRHLRLKKKIIQFTVQLEILSEDKWSPVVRYDTSHGFAHRDIIHLNGKIDKTPVFFYDYTDALTFAEADLISNWHLYRRMFVEEVNSDE